MKTPDLIQTFLFEFADHQNQKVVAHGCDSGQGCLTISVGYLKSVGAVEVSIVHGQQLPARTKNGMYIKNCIDKISKLITVLHCIGLNDVYVEVSLQPDWCFVESSHKMFRTSVQKQTVNPLFGEELHL